MRVKLLWLVLLAAQSPPASAYLDPGAGSFMLQMVLAGALAAGAAIRMYWHRLRAFWDEKVLRRRPRDPSESS